MSAFFDLSPGGFAHRFAFTNRQHGHHHPQPTTRGEPTLPHGPVLPRIRARRAHEHLEELRRRRQETAGTLPRDPRTPA